MKLIRIKKQYWVVGNMFNDKILDKLDDKWTAFREKVAKTQETAVYSILIVKTFPVLYKAWKECKDVVSKDVAVLVARWHNYPSLLIRREWVC